MTRRALETDFPRLPPVYELVACGAVDSAVAEACRRAAQGAEEGTLVWAREQTEGFACPGRAWISPPGNLYCALVLRPDYGFEQAMQLNYVAAVSLGLVVAELASPLSELHYGWPNDVLLNRAKLASAWLALPPEGLEWLVLGLAANVREAPRAAARLSEEREATTVPEVLDAFARHFLSWINRWATDGFAPVRKAWLSRALQRGAGMTLRLPRETLEGAFEDVDEKGVLLLAQPQGTRRVTVGAYFGLDRDRA